MDRAGRILVGLLMVGSLSLPEIDFIHYAFAIVSMHSYSLTIVTDYIDLISVPFGGVRVWWHLVPGLPTLNLKSLLFTIAIVLGISRTSFA